MAKLSIVTYPQKILKRRAGNVAYTSEIQKLVPLMVAAMYDNEGIGLAAPQIGVSKRIIVVEGSETVGETARSKEGRPLVFVNPVITKKTKETETQEEGCLSLPGVFVPVKRAKTVELQCQTPEGQEIKVEAGGLVARIFQHEIDHLNGKLIIDHLNPLKRFKLRKKLKEVALNAP